MCSAALLPLLQPQGYEAQPSLYPAINLATLLVMSGKNFENHELGHIAIFMRLELGTKVGDAP